ncbi:hypothetical protein D8674_000143 [Pyrus ussuriensis x Pyrus communis]|uniref:Uncharacterized protein n=1 Tax=Pyrus ussuriensis x Pyrus communis TaxID=2448454 RepID=A0A5N5F371_9ROSA|nr:hypothetical protein D8674_000143 [Pyrus ussuriensis x Pyrus communis]
MSAKQSSINTNVNPISGDNLPSNASIISRADNPLPQVTATPGASKSPQGVTSILRNNEDLVNRPPHSMDQIWETLMNINTFIKKLQKN